MTVIVAQVAHFAVLGTPAPQGSKKAFAIKKGGKYTGRVAVVEQQKDRVNSWRGSVEHAARLAALPHFGAGVPVELKIAFYLKRPAAHYGTGRNAGLLKASAPRRPAAMPDQSKLIRSTEDAITDAGVWADDGQVVDHVVGKFWADAHPPGAEITITAV
jgi:Holliday junction resolvase RusA-like endonuclease